MKVDRIFTRSIVRTQRAATVAAAAALMRDHHVGALLVVDDEDHGTITGVISLDDIIDALGAELAGLHGILGGELQREMARNRDYAVKLGS